MIRWLLALFAADQTDPAWKPTGLKFVTGRDFLEDRASEMYQRSRTHTPTGRKIPRPKAATVDQRERKNNVVPMVRKGGAH